MSVDIGFPVRQSDSDMYRLKNVFGNEKLLSVDEINLILSERNALYGLLARLGEPTPAPAIEESIRSKYNKDIEELGTIIRNSHAKEFKINNSPSRSLVTLPGRIWEAFTK